MQEGGGCVGRCKREVEVLVGARGRCMSEVEVLEVGARG